VVSERKLEVVRIPGKGGNGTVVRLHGVIDESFDRVSFVEELHGLVILDMDGVRRITSFGVREWVTAMRTLPADYLGFIKVRPAILSQFNMVAGFAGRGQLISFYTPHICTSCGDEVEVLLDLRKQYNLVKTGEPPAATCPRCGAPAEFDDLPGAYFAHAAANPPPTPPPEASPLIDGDTAPKTPAGWKVEKEVEGTVTALWCSGPLDQKSQFKRLADGLEGDVVMVMDQIGAVTPEGIERFKQFADGTDFRLWLARIPMQVAEALVANPNACGRAKLISVRLDFTCTHCGREVRETLDGLNLSLLDSLRTSGKSCPNCWRPLKTEASTEIISQLGRLPFDSAPPAVRKYLETHSRPGSQKPSTEGETWGKYRLEKPIGSGGMAQIFLARQIGPEGFEKRVVLKRLLPHLSDNKLFVEMFLQEARLAAKLSHPNIVQIFDLGKVGIQYYIAMEYVRGWDLNGVLKALYVLKEPMPVHLGCRIVSDVCAALAAAHRPVDEEGRSLAIVHRDVSPQNILLSSEGVVKLTDFGIAKAAGSLTNTEPGMVRGKVAYMSPEQVRGQADIDNRTDIFAAAVILYHCLTGESLFHRENQAATLNALLNDPIPVVSSKRGGIPPVLDQAMKKALARNRDRRYSAAEDFRRDLEAAITQIAQPADQGALAIWLHSITTRAAAQGGEISALPHFTPTSAAHQASTTLRPPDNTPDKTLPGVPRDSIGKK
jgi:serine/threonine protein kinase